MTGEKLCPVPSAPTTLNKQKAAFVEEVTALRTGSAYAAFSSGIHRSLHFDLKVHQIDAFNFNIKKNIFCCNNNNIIYSNIAEHGIAHLAFSVTDLICF